MHLTDCQNLVVQFMKLKPIDDKKDTPIMLQIEVIHRHQDASFYMSLHIGDEILHNFMLDSGASTNVIPLSVMRHLGLNIHKTYRNVCGIYSNSMEVHGLIKDMVVKLVSSLDISTIVDIVVVDIPATYGMLLSRTFSTCLGVTI